MAEDLFPGERAFSYRQQRRIVHQVILAEMDHCKSFGLLPPGQAFLDEICGHYVQPAFRQGLVDLVGGQVEHIEPEIGLGVLEIGDVPVHMDIPQGPEDPHI